VCLHITATCGHEKKFLSSCVSPSLRLNLFLPLDFHPGFMHLHLLHILLKLLHFRCFFSEFYSCFCTLQRVLHFSVSYCPNLPFVGQNALSCGSNKQALPCLVHFPRHGFDDQKSQLEAKHLFAKIRNVDRKQCRQRVLWPAAVDAVFDGWVSITIRATLKLANLSYKSL